MERVDRGGLTYIRDKLFEFFCCVESLCQQLYIEKYVHQFGSCVTKVIQDALRSNYYLQQMWYGITSTSLEHYSDSQADNVICDLSGLFADSASLHDPSPPVTSESSHTVPVLQSPDDTLFVYHMVISRYAHMRSKEFLKRIESTLH